MTSFLTISHGQNATNSAKHCQEDEGKKDPERKPEFKKRLTGLGLVSYP
jgi:hypothetical protein